tara:strand:+ start:76125 stop:76307 length:183 start_codon:yes stop_codon:yes gene_type:complete
MTCPTSNSKNISAEPKNNLAGPLIEMPYLKSRNLVSTMKLSIETINNPTAKKPAAIEYPK